MRRNQNINTQSKQRANDKAIIDPQLDTQSAELDKPRVITGCFERPQHEHHHAVLTLRKRGGSNARRLYNQVCWHESDVTWFARDAVTEWRDYGRWTFSSTKKNHIRLHARCPFWFALVNQKVHTVFWNHDEWWGRVDFSFLFFLFVTCDKKDHHSPTMWARATWRSWARKRLALTPPGSCDWSWPFLGKQGLGLGEFDHKPLKQTKEHYFGGFRQNLPAPS